MTVEELDQVFALIRRASLRGLFMIFRLAYMEISVRLHHGPELPDMEARPTGR